MAHVVPTSWPDIQSLDACLSLSLYKCIRSLVVWDCVFKLSLLCNIVIFIYRYCTLPLNEQDSALLKTSLVKFHKDSEPLEKVLMSNEALATHPLMDPAFLAKGTRAGRPATVGLAQFKKLYVEMQHQCPEQDWTWPPDFTGFDTPEFWGLPKGVVLNAYHLRSDCH